MTLLMPRDDNGLSIQTFAWATERKVAIGAASAAAAAISAGIRMIRLCPDQACYVKLNATATSSDHYIPKDAREILPVEPGDVVNVIQVSTAGTLHITELQ